MCFKTPSLSWLKKSLRKLGFGETSFVRACFYSAKAEPDILLTPTLQTSTGFVDFIVPVGITESNGIFTFNEAGIYKVDIERSYTNEDQSPSSPIELTIETWKNGVFAFRRTGIISAATNPGEPTAVRVASPSILTVEKDDYFELKFSASEGGQIPTSTRLKIVQIAIHKIVS